MAETPYGNVPDMNQYKRFQSDEELLASIKSGVVNYANSGYLDPNYLRAPIDIIAKNAVPYEKPLQDYTSEDVAMLGNRYKAIKSASEFAKKTYRGLAEQSGLDIVKPEELDSYTKQAEEDYLKAIRSIRSPNYGASPLMQIAQGYASSPERLSIATQQLLGVGDQQELERLRLLPLVLQVLHCAHCHMLSKVACSVLCNQLLKAKAVLLMLPQELYSALQ
jgi:hypothetical protein